jgi:hypothetical protein
MNSGHKQKTEAPSFEAFKGKGISMGETTDEAPTPAKVDITNKDMKPVVDPEKPKTSMRLRLLTG